MLKTTLRPLTKGDEDSVLDLQSRAFSGILCIPGVARQLKFVETRGSFVAIRGGSVEGSVGMYKLEPKGWYQIEHLALKDATEVDMATSLLHMALRYLDAKHATYIKASTPSVQPYVGIFEKSGFVPVRRKLDISWDLKNANHNLLSKTPKIQRIPEKSASEAAHVWVAGLRPYWDWWIMEEGGPEELTSWAEKSVREGESWTGLYENGKIVGVTLLRPDRYGKGWAWFNGIYVLPSRRGRGYGSALMKATIRGAKELGQTKLSIYTLAYLDSFAPGAILYLKSGGKIETELLELQKPS